MAHPDRRTVAREAAQLQDAENTAGRAMREGGPTPPPAEVAAPTAEEEFLSRDREGLPFEHMGKPELEQGRERLITRLATEPEGKVHDSMSVLLNRIEEALGRQPDEADTAVPEAAPEASEPTPASPRGLGRPPTRGTDQIMSPIMQGAQRAGEAVFPDKRFAEKMKERLEGQVREEGE